MNIQENKHYEDIKETPVHLFGSSHIATHRVLVVLVLVGATCCKGSLMPGFHPSVAVSAAVVP